MNTANAIVGSPRERRLRELGVVPMRLRVAGPADPDAAVGAAAAATPVASAAVPAAAGAAPRGIRRLALHPDPAELREPGLRAMYTALTAAVGKAGLQAVRVADVAADPGAAVLVFGAAPVPDGVPSARVLRAEALAELQRDRTCKRRLWERMQAMGRGEGP